MFTAQNLSVQHVRDTLISVKEEKREQQGIIEVLPLEHC